MSEMEMDNRILIAEDEPVSQHILEIFLSKWGYEVTVVNNGLEALAALTAENAPRLAVLDWMMPKMEGVEICRKIRERQNRHYTYILLLTARNQKEDLIAGLVSGADDYLTKPFDSQELRARLHVGRRILDLQNQLIRTREELLYRATHDSLTGILNRAEILNSLRREHSRQAREGGSFGVVLLDLDHFKKINDAWGHLAGDSVLKETARRLTASVRAYDSVGRYGGEEFLIVAPSSDSAGVLGLAERIRREIESPPIMTPVGEIQVTASLGIAVSFNSKSIGPDSLIQAADTALYSAKEKGRNRSEMAHQSELAATIPAE
jgi:diguanylate cyclase (GGDEF)-like protein